MGKAKKANIFKRIFSNIFVRNLFFMVVLALLILFGALLYLKIYTRHNQSIEVPSLKGLQVQDVEAIIASSKLKYEVIDSLYQKEGTPGAIIDQIPSEKSKVKVGRTIYLTIQAKNEPLVVIPELEDASLRQAEALLNTLGFTQLKIENVPSQYENLVLAVLYEGNILKAGQEIPKNSALTIRVGDGSKAEKIDDSILIDSLSDDENEDY